MALRNFLIVRKPPPGPRSALPEDRLRGCLEERTALIEPRIAWSTPISSPDSSAKVTAFIAAGSPPRARVQSGVAATVAVNSLCRYALSKDATDQVFATRQAPLLPSTKPRHPAKILEGWNERLFFTSAGLS
jgi:hypothetical protein